MNKITFKCIRSGNLVSFTNGDDIAGLRKHEGYVEVSNAETTKTIEAVPVQAPQKEVLKRPRASKATIPSFLQE